MALFDRFGRRKRTAARLPGGVAGNAWWEIAREFPPERRYDSSEDMGSAFDPMGSYTGVPEDGGVPTQDADDL